MKIIFTFLLIVTTLLAQAQITVSTNTIKWIEGSSGNSSTDYDTTYTVKNNNFYKMHIKWVRLVDNIPSGWATSVCDYVNCFPKTLSSDSFQLSNGASGTMFLHVYPNGIAGTGKVRLKLFDASDTTDVQITTFNINVSATGVATIEQHAPLTVVYNATARHLVVRGFQDAGVQLVEIYNMLGEKVLSSSLYNVSNGEASVDVSTIQSGVYFARLYNNSNQSIVTKKFIK